jgi:hypothetical protein
MPLARTIHPKNADFPKFEKMVCLRVLLSASRTGRLWLVWPALKSIERQEWATSKPSFSRDAAEWYQPS